MNYEVKRFLMDCGEEWRDTYLEYLPEEILEIIYKCLLQHSLQKISKCPYPTYGFPVPLKVRRNKEKRGKYGLNMPIEWLFTFYWRDGIIPMYKSKINRWETAFFCDDEDDDGRGQLQEFSHITFKGVMFEMFDRIVNWERGTIKPQDLRYSFARGNIIIHMLNKTHIKKNTKNVDFYILVDQNICHKSRDYQDSSQNVKMMFDDSEPIQLHYGDPDRPESRSDWTFSKLN